MDDETQLLRRARAVDPDAWELLYCRSYPSLIAYARRRLATQEQAEEAVSETMVRAMDRIEGYRAGPAGVRGWLFGILRNVVLEAYRAGQRHEPADPATLDRPAVVGGSGDPQAAVLLTEQRQMLARAFGRLSDADREILELRVVVGLDAEQVGRVTGRRAGAVRTAHSRALARLRLEFEGLA